MFTAPISFVQPVADGSTDSNSEKDDLEFETQNASGRQKRNTVTKKPEEDMSVPLEMYEALKAKLIGQESEIKKFEEESF